MRVPAYRPPAPVTFGSGLPATQGRHHAVAWRSPRLTIPVGSQERTLPHGPIRDRRQLRDAASEADSRASGILSVRGADDTLAFVSMLLD